MFGHRETQFRKARLSGSRFLGFLLFGWIAGSSFLLSVTAVDTPLQHLKTFSAFSSVDVRRLEAGDVLGEPGSQMSFPHGISTETCFVVRIPAAEAARRLQIWDPSLQGTVKTLEFYPVSKPCTAADFERLSLNPANRSHRWLLEKSLAAVSGKSELNLSRDEGLQLAGLGKARSDPQTIVAYWGKVLLERATQFQRRGFSGLRPYEMKGQSVLPLEHLRALVGEREPVAREFAPLLRQCGMLGGDEKATLDPFHYWAVYEANRHATLTLGAVYLLPLGDERFQLLDVQYYVNGTYYTSATLYEVWPIQLGQEPGALVWRGDFFSAPKLAYTRGVERLAYAAVLLQQLKASIRFFQKEAIKPDIQPPLKPLP